LIFVIIVPRILAAGNAITLPDMKRLPFWRYLFIIKVMILAAKFLLLIVLLIMLLRWKVDLSLAVFLVSLLTIVLFAINLKLAARSAWAGISAGETLELFLIIVLVQTIGAVQKSRRMYDRLVDALNTMIRDKRLVAMASPAIIGFLPMPGGALLSAPLVDVSTAKMKLKPAFNAFLNFWFRHDWELIWPLYAGLLLFQTLSRIPMRRIILFQLPFSILHIAAGLAVSFWYFRRYGIKREIHSQNNGFHVTVRDFFSGTWPILAVILLFFVKVPPLLPLPLHWALLLVTVLLSVLKKVGPREIGAIVFAKTTIRSLLVIAAVIVFQRLIEVSAAFDVLKTMNISLGMAVLFIFLVSFTVAFLTGVNTAYIAIAFPVLLPLIQHLPNYFYLSLYIYVIGFAGILVSPLHLCLVLTNEYFGASLLDVYRYMAIPIFLMIAIATGLVLIL
jgi:integral membrane protein (TIGR00529 family)